jgi:peptide/nickel transport system permease protein
MKRAGIFILVLVASAGLLAPWIAPSDPGTSHRELLCAPPMRVRMVDDTGRWQRPFVYPWQMVSRLERRYEEDRSRRVPIAWFAGGTLARSADPRVPLLLFGADSYGRDVLARLLHGTRLSLGMAAVAVIASLAIGIVVGGIAGYAGGLVDEGLMRLSELVLVLPAIYVILALRAVMPLVLSAGQVFLLLSVILALVGWPYVARGVRATVAAECRRDYATAAVSAGAGHARLLFRHLLPACGGLLAAQATLLVPAFILAEATLSFVGLGFPDPSPSWGAMLQDAANIPVMIDFPWMLAPAGAIFLVVLSVNLTVQGSGTSPVAGMMRGSSR